MTMLKGVDRRLVPDLLHTLARMGHGEVVAVVDGNYPAHAAGAPVVELPTTEVDEMVEAIVSVMPVDTFEGPALAAMVDAEGEPGASLGPVVDRLRAAGERAEIEHLDRFPFYERACEARVVVRTGDERPYSCYLLRKGTI